MIVAFIAVGWIACGTLAYGAVLAYDQNHWGVSSIEEFRIDRRRALLWALLGPCALLASWLSGDFAHGLMYRNPHKK